MKYGAMLIVILLSVTPFATAQTEARAELLTQIEALRADLKTKEAQFLKPSPDDYREFAELASQHDCGLIRLLPREKYDKPDKLTMRGGGAYYSFDRLTHEYGYGSDLELQSGRFSVGFAGADYGFLALIPEQTLLSVTLENPIVAVLAAHEAPSLEPQAREQQRRSSAGFNVGTVRYAGYVNAEVGATYILRSVNYGTSDLLVCFQLLRKDDDGSVIIAWHLLKKYAVPNLNRNQS